MTRLLSILLFVFVLAADLGFAQPVPQDVAWPPIFFVATASANGLESAPSSELSLSGNYPDTVTFAWSPSAGATSYNLKWAFASGQETNSSQSISTTNTTITWPSATPTPTNRACRITIQSAPSPSGPWSPFPNSFPFASTNIGTNLFLRFAITNWLF